MYFLIIYFFLPIIKTLVVVQIHPNSLYYPQSICSFIDNVSIDSSIQSCIWECVSKYDCQTAIYYHNNKTCSMFSERCTTGTINSSGNIEASVICYRKDHNPIVTCPSTLTTIVDLTTTTTFETTITTESTDVPLTRIFCGSKINNPTFITPGYTGYGSALSLDGSQSQYVLVPKFLNMTYRSFTWEIWAYPKVLSINNDYVMVGLCEASTLGKCMLLMIRNISTRFAFWSDDCQSSQIVDINQWHHFAFVYDYGNSTKYIYFNGNLTCKSISSGPFLGNVGNLTIGASFYSGSTGSYWTGYIDQVSYVSRAKTANEILRDATLVAYYSFDNGLFNDSRPNKINGQGSNVSSVPGRINQAILFNNSQAYFQATGFTLLGASYRSYSIALWINIFQSNVTGGIIVHVAASTSASLWCMPFIGLTSNNKIVGQSWNHSMVSVIGPVLPFGIWTHVVTSYSATNGVRL